MADPTSVEKIIIGVFAGLAAVSVKILKQDLDYITVWYYSNDPGIHAKYEALLLSYYILVPILVFLGGLVCWAVDETNRLKLLALGVAAPAMITTFAGGPKSDINQAGNEKAGWYEMINPVTSAFAQSSQPNSQQCPQSSLAEGAKLFFGVGQNVASDKYWVVVGSHKNQAQAESQAAEINKQDPSMKAFVGKRAPCNEYYPVIVGDYLPRVDAEAIRKKAMKLNAVEDSYLSAFPSRR
jgi:hypothetical protein